MYFNKDTQVYLNGQWTKAAEATTGLYTQTMHYGSGVFEGIRSYATDEGTQIFKAEEHFERLKYSAGKMHIDLDLTIDQMVEISYELLDRNQLSDAYIRPLIYTGANMALMPTEEVNIFFCAWKWGRYLGEKLLDVMISSYQRPNPKSCYVEAKVVGHYTNSILATTEAKQKGFDEALLLDMNGYVAEGPGANFFYENKGKIYTCPKGGILSGITRDTILELAQALEIPVEERFFKPEEVKGADGAFFTGTAAEVAGLRSLDGESFKMDWEDTLGHQLSMAYNRLVIGKTYNDFSLV